VAPSWISAPLRGCFAYPLLSPLARRFWICRSSFFVDVSLAPPVSCVIATPPPAIPNPNHAQNFILSVMPTTRNRGSLCLHRLTCCAPTFLSAVGESASLSFRFWRWIIVVSFFWFFGVPALPPTHTRRDTVDVVPSRRLAFMELHRSPGEDEATRH